MNLNSPDGSIEISVYVFSNKFLYGFPTGELRKKKIKCVKKETKANKKDPEENLSNVISTLDTSKIERGVDYIDIERKIDDIISENGITMSDVFGDFDIVASLCDRFEMNLKEFVMTMVEHNPDVFNLSFIRSVIRPFIAKVREEKENYENKSENSIGYRRIFALL